MKEGCLPGGGWGLAKIIHHLLLNNLTPVVGQVLIPSLEAPIERLLKNSGLLDDQVQEILETMSDSIGTGGTTIYDAYKGEMVNALDPENLIVDSVGAVLEALNNAISIASLLGSLGGAVAFGRDDEFERNEASEINNYLRQAQLENPELSET